MTLCEAPLNDETLNPWYAHASCEALVAGTGRWFGARTTIRCPARVQAPASKPIELIFAIETGHRFASDYQEIATFLAIDTEIDF